jgi:peptidoglycan/xylan/chitin deacetylase (PgdA/CDA1 family)
MRVGLWRVADVLERAGVTPSVALNAAVCDHYPEVIEEGVARGWTWLCHGRDNASFHVGMDEPTERRELEASLNTIERACGARPRGWLGPALTETFATPRLLAELGVSYVLDWCNDDEPYALDVEGPRIISVPYQAEVNDIPIFHLRGGSADDFVGAACAHFDRLHLEGAERPSVMGLGIHPFLIGQPSRIGALERVLDHVLGHDGVWSATADEIAAWYLASTAERTTS